MINVYLWHSVLQIRAYLQKPQGNNMTITRVPQLINGEFQQSATEDWIDVTNPATQEVIAQAPCATQAEMQLYARAAPAGAVCLCLGRLECCAP